MDNALQLGSRDPAKQVPSRKHGRIIRGWMSSRGLECDLHHFQSGRCITIGHLWPRLGLNCPCAARHVEHTRSTYVRSASIGLAVGCSGVRGIVALRKQVAIFESKRSGIYCGFAHWGLRRRAHHEMVARGFAVAIRASLVIDQVLASSRGAGFPAAYSDLFSSWVLYCKVTHGN